MGLGTLKNKCPRCEGDDKHFTDFTVEITDQFADLVACVKKTLYVRKKRVGGS